MTRLRRDIVRWQSPSDNVHLDGYDQSQLQKVFNLMQDPYERADVTSNTFWDWNLNHVGSAYGMMDEVFRFVATFNEYPPRSFPPAFNPANLLEEKVREIKAGRKLREAFPMLNKPEEKKSP